MEPLYQIPQCVRSELRAMKGNDKCFECGSRNTDWGSVSMGTLLCIECAGKHRGYGVSISFIRSLSMDTWSEQQLEMMRQGGNGRLRDFFETLNREESKSENNEAWDMLYASTDAESYRSVLKNRVESILKAGGGVSLPSGEVKAVPRTVDPSSSLHRPSIDSEDSDDRDLPIMTRSRLSSASGTNDEELYEDGATHTFTATFHGSAQIGITIKREAGSQAPFVARVHPKSQAETKGVEIMDVILGVNGVTMLEYEDVMKAIQRSPRPIRLTFHRKGAKEGKPASTGYHSTLNRRKPSSLSELKNKPASLELPKQGGVVSVHPHRSSPGSIVGVSGGSASASSTPSKKQHSASSTPRTPLKASSSSSRHSTSTSASASASCSSASKTRVGLVSTPSGASKKSGGGGGGGGGGGSGGTPVIGQQARRRSASGTSASSGRSSPAGAMSGTTPRRYNSEKGTKSTSTSKSGGRSSTPTSGSVAGTAKRKNCKPSTSRERTLTSLSSPSVDSQESPSSIQSPRSRTSSTDINTVFTITETETGTGTGTGGSRVSSPVHGMEALGIVGSPCSPAAGQDEELALYKRGPHEYRAVFTRAPLGLTVTRNSTGTGWVSKVTDGGQADEHGVERGDQLVGIENKWVGGSYDDVVADLSSQQFPLALVFRRNATSEGRR